MFGVVCGGGVVLWYGGGMVWWRGGKNNWMKI